MWKIFNRQEGLLTDDASRPSRKTNTQRHMTGSRLSVWCGRGVRLRERDKSLWNECSIGAAPHFRWEHCCRRPVYCEEYPAACVLIEMRPAGRVRVSLCCCWCCCLLCLPCCCLKCTQVPQRSRLQKKALTRTSDFQRGCSSPQTASRTSQNP